MAKNKNALRVKVKRLVDIVPLPEYKTAGAAGMDLYAAEYGLIPPYETRIIPTGIAVQIPPGFEAQVRSRSGMALNYGIIVLNSPGTIDSDFRGEIGVILHNITDKDFRVMGGDRIAQLVFAEVRRAVWDVVPELDNSARGEGGFGSTGTGDSDAKS